MPRTFFCLHVLNSVNQNLPCCVHQLYRRMFSGPVLCFKHALYSLKYPVQQHGCKWRCSDCWHVQHTFSCRLILTWSSFTVVFRFSSNVNWGNVLMIDFSSLQFVTKCYWTFWVVASITNLEKSNYFCKHPFKCYSCNKCSECALFKQGQNNLW